MLSSDIVKRKLSELNVLYVKADHTDGDPILQRDLERVNRKSLPTNIIYPADPSKPAIMLPEFLNAEILIKALDFAAKAND